MLDEVFAKYNKFIAEKNLRSKELKRESQTNSNALLDFAGANPRPEGEKPKNNSEVIDELGDIFSSDGTTSNIAEPLKPVNMMPTGNYIISTYFNFFKNIIGLPFFNMRKSFNGLSHKSII